MITTSATDLDIIEATASQNSGDVCPSFTLTVKPHLGTSLAVGTHLAWTPPSPLTITVDGLSWVCVPTDAPIRVTASEVVYNVTYYPRMMHVLRRAKLKKPAVWVSAPAWEVDVYLKDLDTDAYHIFTTESDVYTSNGWTVQDILSSLSGIVGFTFVPNFPTLHVSQKTVMCDEQTTILDFVASLLPSGFRYTWDMQADRVTIGLLAPPVANTLTLPNACFSIEQSTPPVETYDSVSITGAPYKLSTGISAGLGRNKLSSQAAVSAPEAYDEDLPVETGVLNGQATRTKRTRTVQLDPFKAPFAILRETETGYVAQALDRRAVTKTVCENSDPVLYETPRVTKTTRAISGWATAAAASAVTNAGAALLTNKLQVLTAAAYSALAPEKKPTVVLSAYPSWLDAVEVVTDTKTYTATTAASKLWPEGCETSNAQVTTCEGYKVNGRFIKRSLDTTAFLQEVASLLRQTGKKTVNSLVAVTEDTDRVRRTLQLQAAGAYRYEETRQTLDAVTGEMHITTAMLPVNSDPPSSPTRWRTAPLTATLDKTSAAGDLVFRLSGSIPTSNPTDFQVWATRLFADMTQPRKIYTLAVPSLIPCGAILGGGMVTGWNCTQKGAVFSASVTVE